MHIKSEVAHEDGPSTALLKFMEAKQTVTSRAGVEGAKLGFEQAPYGFEAPKGWQGIRELAGSPKLQSLAAHQACMVPSGVAGAFA